MGVADMAAVDLCRGADCRRGAAVGDRPRSAVRCVHFAFGSSRLSLALATSAAIEPGWPWSLAQCRWSSARRGRRLQAVEAEEGVGLGLLPVADGGLEQGGLGDRPPWK